MSIFSSLAVAILAVFVVGLMIMFAIILPYIVVGIIIILTLIIVGVSVFVYKKQEDNYENYTDSWK